MVTTTTGLATSFITFSRPGASGGGATVTDRDGKIKWAGHNLLMNSQNLVVLSNENGVQSLNFAVSPDGSTTALKFTEASANAHNYYGQPFSVLASVNYTIAIFAKDVDRRYITIGHSDGTNGFYGVFDLVNNAKSACTAIGTGTPVSSQIQPVGNGWYLCSITGSHSVAGSKYITYGLATSLSPTVDGYGRQAYTSEGKAVLLWGCHAYRSDLGGMQANPAMPANMGSYYPTTPRNLLGYTEDFSNAAWSKGSATVSANAITAPNGLLTADLFKPSTSSEYQGATQSSTFRANTPYVLSFYAKAGGYNWVRGRFFFGALSCDQLFDVSSGVKGTTTNNNTGNTLTSTITSAGNGWFLISMSITAPSNAGSGNVSINIHSGDNGNQLTGDGTSGIYLWGAQLSDSASLDTYTPVYGAAVTSAAYYAPRLDFDPVTLAARGLLVEEQRTNLLLHSAAFDNAAWARVTREILAFGSGSTANSTTYTAPDGSNTSDFVVPNTTNTLHYVATQTVNVASGANSVSCYVRAGGYSWILLQIGVGGSGAGLWFNIGNGTKGSVQSYGSGFSTSAAACNIYPVGNSWYRCDVVVTASSAASGYVDIVFSNGDGGTNVNFAGDGTSGIYIWGAQFEAGSFATSYIPTGSATATRTADVASVSTQAFPYSSSASSLVVSYTAYGDGNENILELSNGSTNGLTFSTSVTGNVISAFVDASSASLGAAVLNQLTKLGLAYDGVSNGAVRNGGTVSSVGTTATAATRMMIGSYSGGGFTMSGHIRQITYLPRRISNAELQSRTA